MSKPKVRLVVLSDLHFMVWKDSNAPVETVPTIEHSLQDAMSLEPDFIVINGDFTNGKERDYRLAMRIIRRICKVPVYYTMGNHEYYGYYEDPEYTPEGAHQRFLSYTGQTSIYYEKTIANTSFIFLSNENYNPDLADSGWLSKEQLAWYERHLVQAPHDPVITFFHQPVNGTVADTEHTCWHSTELREILAKRPGTLFVTGHTHCRMDRDDQLVHQDGTWFVGGGCVCNNTPQSRLIEVYDDEIRLRIRDHKGQQWMSDYDTTIPILRR